MTSRKFDDFPLPKQAGILANDPQFQQFAAAQVIKEGPTFNNSAAAEFIRRHCDVKSRRDLIANPEAAEKFKRLRTDFDAWRGVIAEKR